MYLFLVPSKFYGLKAILNFYLAKSSTTRHNFVLYFSHITNLPTKTNYEILVDIYK